MKKRRHTYRNLMFTLFGAVALSIMCFFIFYRFDAVSNAFQKLMGIIMPFIYGAVIAYVLRSVCNFFDRHLAKAFRKRKRGASLANGLAVTISLVLGLAVVAALLGLVIPSLIDSISTLVANLSNYIQNLINWLENLAGNNEVLGEFLSNLSDSFYDIISNWINNTVLPDLGSIIGSVSSGVVSLLTLVKNVFLGIIISAYLLGMRKTLSAQAHKIPYCLFPEKWANRVIEEFRYIDRLFTGFINGKLIDSLIIGVICFVGTTIMRTPYALLVSVIIGVTNIIPYFGPFIGAIPSFLLILMINPIKALIFLLFVLILQQFDGNFLGPKILGNTTGLSSFWVLFSIILFGGVFGFVGMIIGVPVFAVLYDLARRLLLKGRAHYRKKAEAAAAAANGGNVSSDEGGGEEEVTVEPPAEAPMAVEEENAANHKC